MLVDLLSFVGNIRILLEVVEVVSIVVEIESILSISNFQISNESGGQNLWKNGLRICKYTCIWLTERHLRSVRNHVLFSVDENETVQECVHVIYAKVRDLFKSGKRQL